jgi:hypothetical protein
MKGTQLHFCYIACFACSTHVSLLMGLLPLLLCMLAMACTCHPPPQGVNARQYDAWDLGFTTNDDFGNAEIIYEQTLPKVCMWMGVPSSSTSSTSTSSGSTSSRGSTKDM